MVDMVLDQTANQCPDGNASSGNGVPLVVDPPNEIRGLERGHDLFDFSVSGT
jgi:hypothetical protein